MEMKWHPIEDGNMKGIPRDEEVIFTVLVDEDTGEVRTASGKVDEYFLKKYGYVSVGTPRYPVETKTLKAWMELPEPSPERCFKCNHGHLQHDEDSDNWFECELLQRAVPTIGKPEDCPLKKEV